MRFGIKILIICVVFVKDQSRYQVMQNTIVRTSVSVFGSQNSRQKGGCRLPKTGENIYKRKDGRWEARFISGRKPDGCAKYTSVYARTYAEQRPSWRNGNGWSCHDLPELPLDGKELCMVSVTRQRSSHLHAPDMFLIEHHILPELGSIFVVSLTAKQLLTS